MDSSLGARDLAEICSNVEGGETVGRGETPGFFFESFGEKGKPARAYLHLDHALIGQE